MSGNEKMLDVNADADPNATEFSYSLYYCWYLFLYQNYTLCCTVTQANRHNGELRGPVTFSPTAKRLAMELSLHVLTI